MEVEEGAKGKPSHVRFPVVAEKFRAVWALSFAQAGLNSDVFPLTLPGMAPLVRVQKSHLQVGFQTPTRRRKRH